VAALWFGVPMLGLVIGLAMVLTLVVAALGGILMPMALERLGIDPALASGPFVTTVTDVVGFLPFWACNAGAAMTIDLTADQGRGAQGRLCRAQAAFAAGAGRRICWPMCWRASGKALAGYMPMRTEIDPLPAMAAHRGRSACR
jgi:hypothetical protein